MNNNASRSTTKTTTAVTRYQSFSSSPTSSTYESDVDSPLTSPSSIFQQQQQQVGALMNDFIMYRPSYLPEKSTYVQAYRLPEYTQTPSASYSMVHHDLRYGHGNFHQIL